MENPTVKEMIKMLKELKVPYMCTSSKEYALKRLREIKSGTRMKDYLKYHEHSGCEMLAWAIAFGNRDIIRPYIRKERNYAYDWAVEFPEDKDVVFPDAMDGTTALKWAIRFPEDKVKARDMITHGDEWIEWVSVFPEDKEIAIGQIWNGYSALKWAKRFPEDKEVMRSHIDESNSAFLWACEYPEDKRRMVNKIKDSKDAYEWANKFGNRAMMFNHIKGSHIIDWINDYGDRYGHRNLLRNRIKDLDTALLWMKYLGRGYIKDKIIIDNLSEKRMYQAELARMYPEDRKKYLRQVYQHDSIRNWMYKLLPHGKTYNIEEEKGVDYEAEREYLISCIQDSKIALSWAAEFPKDKDLMIPHITDPGDAYQRALAHEEDRDIMMPRVTTSQWALNWALNIGDIEIMRDRVVDPFWAEVWIRDIGDKDIMLPRIKDPIIIGRIQTTKDSCLGV